MILSKKMQTIGVSPTLVLNARAQEMRAQGKDVISFAVGEPHYGTPQVIVDAAIRALQQGRTRYGVAGGGSKLRALIAEKLRGDNGLVYAPEAIVVGIGAKEILFHTLLAMLNPGDEVIVPAPYWVSYSDQIIAAGGVPVVVPGTFRCVPAAFDAYVTPKTVALIINSPNNPTGYVLTPEELDALSAFARRHPQLWLILDEIYEYLAFDRPHESLLQRAPDLMERAIIVNGFSKGFAMTGWRVGYAAGPTSIISIIRNLQSHSSTCIPTFIEDAACVALEYGRKLLESDIRALGEQRLVAYELGQCLHPLKPEGAFYLWCDVRAFAASGVQFAEMLLEEHNVIVVPGEAFGCAGFVRCSFALSRDHLEKGMARIRKAIG